MNVLIASETPFGAVLCDAFWRKLILGSIDPYIAEKKNSLTFLYHGKSSAVPIAQESYNENYDQDFDAIKLVEFNDSQSYADSFSEIIHSKSYDIVVFVDAQNSVFNIEGSAEELFAASKDAQKCVISAVTLRPKDAHDAAMSLIDGVDLQLVVEEDFDDSNNEWTPDGKIDVIASDSFCDRTNRVDAFSSCSENPKDVAKACVSELLSSCTFVK